MKCQYCQEEFAPKNKKGRFCSTKCRVYFNRNGSPQKPILTAPVEINPLNQIPLSNQTPEAIKVQNSYTQEDYLEEYEEVYLRKKAPSYANQKSWDLIRQKRLLELAGIINSFDNQK
jgi:hypothetical protein